MTAERCALVTGGATGLGASVAEVLAAAGWQVVVTEHLRPAGDRVTGIRAVPCDLRDDEAIDRLVDALLVDETTAAPTALVHCATVFERRPLARGARRRPEPATSDPTAVHLGGVDRIIRAFGTAGRHPGRIVLVGSAGATWGGAGLTAYGAHKAAMRGYVRGLAAEWQAHGTVNLVEPGPMATDLAAERSEAWQRDAERSPVTVAVAPPRQVAGTIAFLLGDDAANLSGAVLPVDGGLMAGVAP